MICAVRIYLIKQHNYFVPFKVLKTKKSIEALMIRKESQLMPFKTNPHTTELLCDIKAVDMYSNKLTSDIR